MLSMIGHSQPHLSWRICNVRLQLLVQPMLSNVFSMQHMGSRGMKVAGSHWQLAPIPNPNTFRIENTHKAGFKITHDWL